MEGTLSIRAVFPQGAYWPLVGAGLIALVLLPLGLTAAPSTPAVETVPLALGAAATALKESVVSNGVVDGIRELPAEAGSSVRRFEMKIRMRDGTLRVSNEAGGARWQVGDRIRTFGSPAGT